MPPSILYEQKFNRLLIQHYLIYDEISLRLLKSAYVKELNLHHSNKKYLENKYIHHLDDLGKAISCLSHEEQLKLDSMYHIHKVVPIEEKICYAFLLVAL